MKVKLDYTNNPAYAGLAGREGDLQIENGQFRFTYMDGQETKSFSSHIDGQLGQLGHYKSPEVVIRTGMCEFVFDQRDRQQEIQTPEKDDSPKIITYEQYHKTTMKLVDARREAEKTGQGEEDVKVKAAKKELDDIIDAEKKGDLIIVVDIDKYVEEKLSQTDLESGKIGDFEFNKIACSDTMAIYRPNGDMVATYSQNTGLVMNDGYKTLEQLVDEPVKDVYNQHNKMFSEAER